MRVVLPVALLLALALPGTVRGDIGIRRLSVSMARPGDTVSVVAAGYLGSKPWRPMPVVMIPAALAPEPFAVPGGFAAPRARRSQLRPPRYRVVGSIARWRARDRTGVNATGRLVFHVPRVSVGRYVFALFCDACTPGPAGSLIIDEKLVLRVLRSS
jgi:hypothetical protein